MKVSSLFKALGALMMIAGVIIMAMTMGGWPAFALWMALAGSNLYSSVSLVESEIHRQKEAETVTEELRYVMDAREERIRQWVISYRSNRA